MKTILFIFSLAICFSACQNPNAPSVTMGDSPEIDMMKKMVENYEQGYLDANLAFYSDTAKIYPQGWGLDGISPQKDMENTKAGLEYFSDVDVSDEIYEVVTVDGTHWLHFWGVWSGKLKADGSEVKMPFFMNPGIKDGKIQMMSFYADGTIIANAMAKAAEAQQLAEDVGSDDESSD